MLDSHTHCERKLGIFDIDYILSQQISISLDTIVEQMTTIRI